VIINTFKYLGSTKRDAAYGISGLIFLYSVRFIFARVEARARNPLVKRIAFFVNTLRTAFAIIMLTIFAWVHLRGTAVANYDISVLKDVPSGFQHMGAPSDINADLIGRLGPLIPVSTIILLLEHIAIAKSESHHLLSCRIALTIDVAQVSDVSTTTRLIPTKSSSLLELPTRSVLSSVPTPRRVPSLDPPSSPRPVFALPSPDG
jgi:hypothetical protein